jgi:hypothetical protein
VALGHLGDQVQAASALRALVEKKTWLFDRFREEAPVLLERADQLETYLEGLRKAGVT